MAQLRGSWASLYHRRAGWLRRRQLPGITAPAASREVAALAERLGAQVSTTLQGLSALPATHRLRAGFCVGPAAVPAAENALHDSDCLLAAGTRFSEIATGSYGYQPPADLVHVDVNPAVFNANYPARVALEGDAAVVLGRLLRPAAVGAKLARPQAQVVGIVDDGAFRMTGLELATAAVQRLGVVVFVFSDGELAQIAQVQQALRPRDRGAARRAGAVATGRGIGGSQRFSRRGPSARRAP